VAVYRTLRAFETWLKKGARGTDYVFPSEMLVQMNVIVDFKNQHRYNEDEFLDRIQAEMGGSLMERVRRRFLFFIQSSLRVCSHAVQLLLSSRQRLSVGGWRSTRR